MSGTVNLHTGCNARYSVEQATTQAPRRGAAQGCSETGCKLTAAFTCAERGVPLERSS